MRNERDWRESLGAYVLGQLPQEERASLEAHLEGCSQCQAELDSLAPVARMMPLADPVGFGASPSPPRELGNRILATIEHERRLRRRRREIRFGFVLAGAAVAAIVAVLSIFVLAGGPVNGGERRVAFASLPPGMKIEATLQRRAFGTEIEMHVEGVRSGTLCHVALVGLHGLRLSAGTFRYRYGSEEQATLNSGLALSRTKAIVVQVGSRVFTAPVGAHGPA